PELYFFLPFSVLLLLRLIPHYYPAFLRNQNLINHNHESETYFISRQHIRCLSRYDRRFWRPRAPQFTYADQPPRNLRNRREIPVLPCAGFNSGRFTGFSFTTRRFTLGRYLLYGGHPHFLGFAIYFMLKRH